MAVSCVGLLVCPWKLSGNLGNIHLCFHVTLEKRYKSSDGYGRAVSERGSVFRHGTLRWTYALRSKRALCLPQCIPNRSDKVPPLCDPDPLLIMDRLQNRPLGGRTGPPHRAAAWSLRGELWHVDEHTWYDMSTFMRYDSLKKMRRFSLASEPSLHSNYSFARTGYLLEYRSMLNFKEKEQLPSFAKFLPVFRFFCWSSNAQDLVSIRAISLSLAREISTSVTAQCFKLCFISFSKPTRPQITSKPNALSQLLTLKKRNVAPG